jgi:alpha-L-fucosidase
MISKFIPLLLFVLTVSTTTMPMQAQQASRVQPQTASRDSYQLPTLPPMPAIPSPLARESLPLGDAESAPVIKADFPISEGPYEPTWESISKNYPDGASWLRDAKFGIWVHFGAQSAGQSGDWYAKRLYLQDGRPNGKYKHHHENHLKNYGHPSEMGYKDLLRTWNPDKLDPARLSKLYKDAGARFLIIQGVHHDNFDNWNSKYHPWNSVNLGPKRDLLKEWTVAARTEGLRYGVAFHHENTWWWYQAAFRSDTSGPKAGVPYDGNLTKEDGKGKWWEGYDPRLLYTIDLREYQGLDVEFAPRGGIFTRHQEYAKWYITQWALRIMDVIQNYDPDFIYTDGNSTQPFSGLKSGTGAKSDAIQRIIAHYYNRTLKQRGSVDTFSIVKFHPPAKGITSTQEGSFPADIKRDQPWIGEVAVGDWFYAPGFHYDARALIRHLLECVSRDGSVCASISLRPDGSLDDGSQQMLKEAGEWMTINGEGIYGSKAWAKFGEGEKVDGRIKVSPRGHLGKRQAEFPFGTNDFRFTQDKDGSIYVYSMIVPHPGSILKITSLGTDAKLLDRPISSVKLLGSDSKIEWQQTPEGLVIHYPQSAALKIAAGFKITCQ